MADALRPAARGGHRSAAGLLVLRRDVDDGHWLGRRFHVVIDGVQVGRLVRGGRVALALPAGEHGVQVFSAVSGSPPLQVTVQAGDQVELRVSTSTFPHLPPVGLEWPRQPPALLLTPAHVELPNPPGSPT